MVLDKLNVMIVDDSLIIRRNLKKIILELGHNVVFETNSGRGAVDNYGLHMPDLVTMDITMPDMDGIQAVKKIKQEFPDANIVMVTSHGQEEMVRNAIISGARGYILKPIVIKKVEESIDKIFG